MQMIICGAGRIEDKEHEVPRSPRVGLILRVSGRAALHHQGGPSRSRTGVDPGSELTLSRPQGRRYLWVVVWRRSGGSLTWMNQVAGPAEGIRSARRARVVYYCCSKKKEATGKKVTKKGIVSIPICRRVKKDASPVAKSTNAKIRS